MCGRDPELCGRDIECCGGDPKLSESYKELGGRDSKFREEINICVGEKQKLYGRELGDT